MRSQKPNTLKRDLSTKMRFGNNDEEFGIKSLGEKKTPLGLSSRIRQIFSCQSHGKLHKSDNTERITQNRGTSLTTRPEKQSKDSSASSGHPFLQTIVLDSESCSNSSV
jgi:hypothetical protein